MPIKSILALAYPLPGAAARLAVASLLAQRHDAWLTALFTSPSVDPSLFAQAFAGPAAENALHAATRDMQRTAEIQFHAATQDLAEDRRTWVMTSGNILQNAAAWSRHADLTIVGQPEEAQPREERISNHMIVEGSAPVLVLPDNATPRSFDRILVTWNGSRENMRAVRDALPLLTKARQVEVLAVTRDRTNEENALALGTPLQTYLNHHGIVTATRYKTFDPHAGLPGAILKYADHAKSDLIVMGGFGRSRIREAVTGSTTDQILTESRIPLLVSH